MALNVLSRVLFRQKTRHLLCKVISYEYSYFICDKGYDSLFIFDQRVGKPFHSTAWNGYVKEYQEPLIKYHHKRPKSQVKSADIQEPIDIDELVNEVINKATAVDKMVMSIPKTSIKKNVALICNLGASKSEVLNVFLKKPSYLRTDQLQSIVDGLKSYGFKGPNILQLFLTTDNLYNVTLERIETVFEWLRSQGMVEKDIIQTFQKDLNVVNLSSKQISNRVKNLKALFKSADVYALIKSVPSILYDDMNDLTEKFMYVHQTMGISQRQIMYSHLFHHPIQHIVNRHVFLERTGFFIKDTKRQAGFASKNPLLQDIVDTTDAEFAHKFGKMTSFEYRTFCKLLEKEVKLDHNSDEEFGDE